MKSVMLTLALCLLAVLTGCTSETKPAADGKSKTTKAPPAADSKPVDLKPVKLAEFQDAIKAEKGKIVVIDFWATWCPPCVKAFPHHVELHEKYRGKDVVCMSVSFDKKDDKEQALKFLDNKKATFANFIPSDDPETWQKHWDIGAIPATMVYDQAGELHPFRNSDEKSFTPGDVDHLVEKLLKK